VTFIGRLDPVKRVHVAVEAACRLEGLVHLHVWGEGPARPVVESALGACGIPARQWITLHGGTAHPGRALSESGLLVLPSSAEGFGLVLIEAMAAGVPVIGTNVPGIRDVVRHGETGLLVDDGSDLAGAFADTMRRVIEDQDLRRRLVKNGLTEVRERYRWESVMPSYQRLLGLGARR
jgi:glycosyltransferase involved in cell wall biosynthesis